ncbi:MAG TPA: ParB/RepB/Spo0J family partition protein, partial [Candidatus Thermoplasmatota archaeon]|nr:ParB/RepB/Spo0J family partition protein [Candidatus Thermoplasmatota archaeon]
MAKTTTTTKKEAKKPSVPELARIDLPVQQQGLEKWAANPEDVIGRAADSPATVVNIPLEVIVESTENARRTFDQAELEGLAQSMRAVGLREAVELKPRGARDDGSPGAYELVDGARRYRAAKLLGWKTIPAWIHNDSDLVTATVRAVRNNQRVNLTPYEEALDFRNIMEKGATVDQVAALVGRSPETVKSRLEILDLPEDVAKRVGENG